MAHHKVEHGHHKRASGGGAEESRMKELEEDVKEGRGDNRKSELDTESEADKGGYGGHKRGGEVKRHKRKHGGKVHHGHMAMQVEGKHPAHRMDRPGRKRGGGVGADSSPMTAASRLTAPKGVHEQTKTDKEDD